MSLWCWVCHWKLKNSNRRPASKHPCCKWPELRCHGESWWHCCSINAMRFTDSDRRLKGCAKKFKTCAMSSQPQRRRGTARKTTTAATKTRPYENGQVEHRQQDSKPVKERCLNGRRRSRKMSPCQKRNTNATNDRQTQIPRRYGYGFGLSDLLTWRTVSPFPSLPVLFPVHPFFTKCSTRHVRFLLSRHQQSYFKRHFPGPWTTHKWKSSINSQLTCHAGDHSFFWIFLGLHHTIDDVSRHTEDGILTLKKHLQSY